MAWKLAVGTLGLSALAIFYWLESEPSAHPKRSFDIGKGAAVTALTTVLPPAENERFTSEEATEVIDLSRVFEPTGQETELSDLLSQVDAPEDLSLPRVVEPEKLPAPRILAAQFPEAAEEQSSPPNRLEMLTRQLTTAVANRVALALTEMQALKGSTVPEAEGILLEEQGKNR